MSRWCPMEVLWYLTKQFFSEASIAKATCVVSNTQLKLQIAISET